MATRQRSVTRKGQIYRLIAHGTEFSAFIWSAGAQFCGRIEGRPDAPQATASTIVAVRERLHQWLVAQGAPAGDVAGTLPQPARGGNQS